MTSPNLQPLGLRRLYHQRITHPTFKDAGEVVAWLGSRRNTYVNGTVIFLDGGTLA